MRGRCVQRGHFGELNLDELAEERPHVDARKKIARAPGTAGSAGVVAELGMVEREVHERGDGERAAFTDDVRDHSLRTVTNTSPSPRQSRIRA